MVPNPDQEQMFGDHANIFPRGNLIQHLLRLSGALALRGRQTN